MTAISTQDLPFILNGTYFKVKEHNTTTGKVLAECIICAKTGKVKVINGAVRPTSNFTTHLKRSHTDKHDEYIAYKISKKKKIDFGNNLSQKVSPQTTFNFVVEKCSKSQEHDNILVIDYIIESMSPLLTVEGEKFKKLIKGFHSDSSVMCRKTLKITLFNQAAKLRQVISNQLKAAPSICITADVWSIGKESYFGSTAHILDTKLLDRKSFALTCRRFIGLNTYDQIVDILLELMNIFDISQDKIQYIIIDNRRNFIKPFEEYQMVTTSSNIHENSELNVEDEIVIAEELSESESEDDKDTKFINTDEVKFTNLDTLFQHHLIFEKKLPSYFKCASHTLSLVIKKDAEKITPGKESTLYTKLLKSSMGKCFEIFNKSTKQKAADIIKIICGKQIFSPNKTHWNSHFDALVKLLSVKNNLEKICTLLSITQFTNQEIQFLEEYVRAVRPLAIALDILQGEEINMDTNNNKLLFGSLTPAILSVETKLNEFLKETSQNQLNLVKPLVHALLDGLSHRFSYIIKLDSNNITFRNLILATISIPYFKLRWIPHGKLQEFKNLFMDEVIKIADLNSESLHFFIKEEPNLDSELFEFPFQNSSVNGNTTNIIKLECLQYFENLSTELYSLHCFPNIKKLFLIHNTSIPSSAPVEKILNFTGMNKTPRKNIFEDDDVFETLLFLKYNEK